MGDDIKQEEVASLVPEHGMEFAGRRKVIKGLAATVPVIMTITSGQAAAQASIVQCIGKPTGVAQPEWEDINATNPDIWVRETRLNPATNTQMNRLVYADQNGAKVENPMAGNPFTLSCHMSFMPTTP